MLKSKDRDLNKKKAYLQDHFCYEIEMLIWAHNANSYDRIQTNVKIEIFFSHARVLYDFLLEKPHLLEDKSSLKALFFLDERVQWCPNNTLWNKFRTKTSGTISHLGKYRWEEKYNNNEIHSIFLELEKIIFQFIDLLSPSYVDIKNKVNNLLETIIIPAKYLLPHTTSHENIFLKPNSTN